MEKISFGGIPNSSSIDIPCLTTSAPFCAIVLPMWTMLSPWSKQSITWLSLSRSQGTNPTGTLHNLPNAASGTYTNTRRNSSEPSGGTFRTLPPEPTPTRAGTLRNPPEPSGTCLRNLPFYTGTLRNLTGTCLRNLHQQTPELPGTFRNLPEPSSGTCSCNPHRHTPELIWAEDSISLRCWGKKWQCFLVKLFLFAKFWKLRTVLKRVD